jgi:hypothetical protein
VALMLNNLGTEQREVNALEAAKASYDEALAIRRKLAKRDPVAYGSDLVGTLNNVGNLQRAMNEPEAARVSHEEGLRICHKLAQQQPEVSISRIWPGH